MRYWNDPNEDEARALDEMDEEERLVWLKRQKPQDYED